MIFPFSERLMIGYQDVAGPLTKRLCGLYAKCRVPNELAEALSCVLAPESELHVPSE